MDLKYIDKERMLNIDNSRSYSYSTHEVFMLDKLGRIHKKAHKLNKVMWMSEDEFLEKSNKKLMNPNSNK